MQIRLASLLPDGLDLGAAARDLELLTERLARVPGFTFAMIIRDVLQKARRRRVLPPLSARPSPGPASSTDTHKAPAHAPYERTYAPVPESSARLEPYPPPVVAGDKPSPASSLDSTLFSGSPASCPRQLLTADMEEEYAPPSNNQAAPLDFMYAEQLWPKLASPTTEADKDFSLDAWFPFPPLGERRMGRTVS